MGETEAKPLSDADRYVVLLAFMGRIEKYAAHWSPHRHPPLLRYLQECIDRVGAEVGHEWIEEQRRLLNRR